MPSVHVLWFVVLRGGTWRRLRKVAEFVGECGGFVPDLFDELAAEALDEGAVLGGDDGDLRCGDATGGVEVVLDFLVGGVVGVADVALGEADVFPESTVGVCHPVEDVDDGHVGVVLGRVVLVSSLFAVTVGPVLSKHFVGLAFGFVGRLLVAVTERLELRLGLGKFGLGFGGPYPWADERSGEHSRLEVDVTAAGHPVMGYVIVRCGWFGRVETLQEFRGLRIGALCGGFDLTGRLVGGITEDAAGVSCRRH
ncbi:hypothetical protein B1790_32300 [Mycobacterium sp. AT1]|nr:hypothetical protein B1790_32300 [Mycobacterium sp. AT1]